MRNISTSFVLACSLVASATFGVLVSTAGCGGDSGSSGGGGGAGGTGGTGGSTTAFKSECFDYAGFDPNTSVAVSFKTDVLPIFQRSCGLSDSCHGNASVPKALQPYLGPNKDTTATAENIAQILAGIVGKKSVTEPSMDLVAASDPEHSFLMYKLDGEVLCDKLSCAANNKCGDIMPQGYKTPMKEEERMTIRYWIAQGAANN